MAFLIEKETGKCPDCGGNGSFIEDYHDPQDFHGHGQREDKCLRCNGTGEVHKGDTYEDL